MMDRLMSAQKRENYYNISEDKLIKARMEPTVSNRKKLDKFYNYVSDGTIARAGATKHGHKIVKDMKKNEKNTGSERDVHFNEYYCVKPDCWRSLGLDQFVQQEDIRRKDDRLNVTNYLRWHGDKNQKNFKSTAAMKYSIDENDSLLNLTMNDWDISLKGIKWPIRNVVEKEMRKELNEKHSAIIEYFVTLCNENNT